MLLHLNKKVCTTSLLHSHSSYLNFGITTCLKFISSVPLLLGLDLASGDLGYSTCFVANPYGFPWTHFFKISVTEVMFMFNSAKFLLNCACCSVITCWYAANFVSKSTWWPVNLLNVWSSTQTGFVSGISKSTWMFSSQISSIGCCYPLHSPSWIGLFRPLTTLRTSYLCTSYTLKC